MQSSQKIIEDYTSTLITTFHNHANPVNAVPMKQYMKNRFPFLGIKTPERKELQKEFLKKERLPDIQYMEPIVKILWQLPEREFHYFAREFAVKYIKQMTDDHIGLFEYMILTKSWWDTVDLIATHLVGVHFKRYPKLTYPFTERWLHSGNKWLQRTAILFQLKYKQETDFDLLDKCIQRLADSNEFFLQKAIGWALREYSKTDPKTVEDYVNSHALMPLSHKEALKYLQKQ
jgi:3-methyladenine DNA glycosylase AlkD